MYMKVGLFFGSFNPVHVGHLIIANYMVEHTDLDRIWMVVSPQNPFKERRTLANDYDRLHLLNLALEGHEKIESSNVEFSMPKPSYTIDTLTYLKEHFPTKTFTLIMGGDNLASFHKWKNYEKILVDHEIYVYKRSTHSDHQFVDHPQVHVHEAPMLNISSSYIRRTIKEGKSIQYLVTDPVFEYLKDNPIYENMP